jgi:hypothetical protein
MDADCPPKPGGPKPPLAGGLKPCLKKSEPAQKCRQAICRNYAQSYSQNASEDAHHQCLQKEDGEDFSISETNCLHHTYFLGPFYNRDEHDAHYS